jgi:hypothetical protein
MLELFLNIISDTVSLTNYEHFLDPNLPVELGPSVRGNKKVQIYQTNLHMWDSGIS